MSEIFKFTVRLLVIISAVFLLHIITLYFLNKPLFENKIIEAYIVNYALASAIYIGLFKLKDSQPNNLGYLFMAGSFIKFGIFFIVFYPAYKADENMSTLEFSSFFIPYAVSLIFETKALTKMLNKLGEK